MNIHKDNQEQKSTICVLTLEGDSSAQLPRLDPPTLGIDQLPTQFNPITISKQLLGSEPGIKIDWSMCDIPTQVLPVIYIDRMTDVETEPQKAVTAHEEGQIAMLRKLVKSSGIYALSSVAVPLVSLVLAPFLTHHLSPSDYGTLSITNTAIGLCAGFTQLGLASAFFRAYSYDYTSQEDRLDVVATVSALLCLVSIPTAIAVAIMAPWLANLLFGRSSLGNCVSLAGVVVLLQNLTLPGMSWLRAKNRSLLYSLLSVGNLLVALFANIFLMGVLHWGILGSVIAMGSGFACIVICTMPMVILRTGIKIRVDIARGLLAFGLPLVLNFASSWVLQLSDRYLLSLFASLTETAHYTVAYTLGGAMNVVIIVPFNLAWPMMFFAIAKRKDATEVFKLVFRWYGMFLLFAAFGCSLVATIILDWLFPVTYRAAASIIPVVAESMAFYGVYNVFMAGASIKRKTWLTAVFTTIAAVINFVLNLFLIPLYGAMGAATSTLIAYFILGPIAYVVNQRLYPVPFEIGLFIVALFIGVVLYVGSSFLAGTRGTHVAWGIYPGALVLYGGCLALLGALLAPSQNHKNKNRDVLEEVVS